MIPCDASQHGLGAALLRCGFGSWKSFLHVLRCRRFYRTNRRDIIRASEALVTSQTVVLKEIPLPSGSGSVSSAHIPVRALSTPASCAVFWAAICLARCAANLPLKITQRKKTPSKISWLFAHLTRPPARFCDNVLTFIFSCEAASFFPLFW